MYDPLVHPFPDRSQPDPDSYWLKVGNEAPADDGPVAGDLSVDVAIIGGGYTGLSAALALGRDHGIKATVLEARSSAWGCSGRNGSFARISGGRVPWSSLVKTYGRDTARAYFDELRQGLDTVRDLISTGGIACDKQPDGVYKVAAFGAHAGALRREEELYNEVLGYPARYVDAGGLHGVHEGPESHGALYLPDGFSLNPLELARGLHRMARSHGARIHTNSPATDWMREGDTHRLVTPAGTVRARRVIVATNGYTSSRLHPRLAARILPVHSQIIVTAPMSQAQVEASLPSGKCMFDTRGLLFYYRRLPDDRMLFGGRSAISGSDAAAPRHRQYLYDAMTRKFPALAGISVDHWWGGWVAVTRNSLPFCYRVPAMGDVFTAGGYAGSGVSFSIHLGTKLALMAAGRPFETGAAFLAREPERYPFASFIRLGQWMAYRWLHARDAREARRAG
ncbi:NAD(P)/FAD-dependent oxidoreductase [Shinella pollutisoli]|uniref:NAD(P)/FAD-dependent oxidoreductase n=1 Tax=Shinella pollutisoli TaxID=2250594 RepID=A0ABV7DH12_9HYPH|nr:FAD-binding oxidoreductase [Shinella pollutisoli]